MRDIPWVELGFLVLGAVLALGGGLISEGLKSVTVGRVAARLIESELRQNEAYLLEVRKRGPVGYYPRDLAWNAHPQALAARVPASTLDETAIAYGEMRRLAVLLQSGEGRGGYGPTSDVGLAISEAVALSKQTRQHLKPWARGDHDPATVRLYRRVRGRSDY